MRLFLWTALALTLAGCGDAGLQPQKHFDAALANNSTAPSIVRIELVQHGKPQVLCVYAYHLIRAIMAERRLEDVKGYDEAVAFAKSSKQHRFVINNIKALEALNLTYNGPQRAQGCAIIARGRPAFRDDISGQVLEGSPFGNL